MFILTLGTLNNVIREDQEIKGERVKGEEFKLLAFADDVVYILKEPECSLKTFMNKIADYGEVAGLRINWDKTKMITKNIQSEKVKKLVEQIEIKVEKKVKHLGITMSNKCSTLMVDNYLKVIKEIQKDLE